MIRNLSCLDSLAAGHRHLVRCGSTVEGGSDCCCTCGVGIHRVSVLGVGVCVICTASSSPPHIVGARLVRRVLKGRSDTLLYSSLGRKWESQAHCDLFPFCPGRQEAPPIRLVLPLCVVSASPLLSLLWYLLGRECASFEEMELD